MPLTRLQLQTRAARDFGEPGMVRVTAGQWQDYLGDGVLDFCTRTKCRREWVPFVSAQDNVTIPNAEYIPDGGVLVDSIEYLQTDCNVLEHRKIFEAVEYDIHWYWNNGTPFYYLFGDYRMQVDNRQQVVAVFPVPIVSLTSLRGVVIRVPAPMDSANGNDAQVSEIPEPYQRAPLYYALGEAFDAKTELRDPQRAAENRAKYADLVALCKGAADARFTTYPAQSQSWWQ